MQIRAASMLLMWVRLTCMESENPFRTVYSLFFFSSRRRHTRLVSDWSSDVCSSDLLRDLVHAIPLYAIKAGALTVAKAGKKNIFSGRILEIEGLPDLKVEQAFELSDA